MFTQTKVTGGLVCHIGLLFWEFGNRRRVIWNLRSWSGPKAVSVTVQVSPLSSEESKGDNRVRGMEGTLYTRNTRS